MSNLDNRISNADQLLTSDIDKFCETVVDLYSQTTKPLLDIGIYLYRLTVNLGPSVRYIMKLILCAFITYFYSVRVGSHDNAIFLGLEFENSQ